MGHRVVGQRAQRLLAAALVVAAGRRLRRQPHVPQGRRARACSSSGTRRWSTTARRCRNRPTRPSTRSRSSGRCSRRRWSTPSRRGRFEAQGQLDEALREYRKASEFDPSNRSIAARAAELDRAAARAARGVAAAAADRAAARAGPQGLAGADPQPDVARPAQPAFHQHQPARPAQLHRQCHRHQRHLRPRLPGPHRHGAARGRHPGAGAPAGDAVQPDLLQGAERADDHRRHRQHRQAPAVRRAGDQDLLRLARRRHRAGPAGQHRDPGAADGHPAAHRPQQDRQHHHRAGLGPGHADHRADHPHQRPAARRGGDRRADPRGEPRADQALRAEPHRLRHRRHLLARAVALRQYHRRTR